MGEFNTDQSDSWTVWSKHVLIELQSLRKEFLELRQMHADALLEQAKQFAKDLADLKQFHNDDIKEVNDAIGKISSAIAALKTRVSMDSGLIGGIVGGIVGIISSVVASIIVHKMQGG